MNMTEASNVIEILRGLGWNGEQIADFQLGVEGRITVSEAVDRVRKEEKEENK